MKNYQAPDVESYLQTIPENYRTALEHLRQTIKTAAPLAEENISYMMPAYKYLGPLVYFGASKNNLAFYVVQKNIITKFRTDLQAFKTSGTAIHFTPEQPLPDELVKKIVAERLRQNEEIQANKKIAAQAKAKSKKKAAITPR